MNPDLIRLQPYPFERLAQLKAGITPNPDYHHIALSIGEPKHPAPDLVIKAMSERLSALSGYPLTRGMAELRETIAHWLTRRFNLTSAAIDPDRHVLPVNGTREALFAFAQATINRSEDPIIVMPNPFYQIYEGAALLAGATPWFLNTTESTGFLPDFTSVPAEVWSKTKLIYICSPGNPTGRVIPSDQLQVLIQLADQYDFVIASDECYSELYFDEHSAPTGLLDAASQMGNTDFERCIVFHSLSKRSNLPGLRSGFVAGDARIIEFFLKYRTYHGCAMSPPSQYASIAAWSDEQHVRDNRRLYREKFRIVMDVLGDAMNLTMPDAGFYLWPQTPIDDETFCAELFRQYNLTVLPGRYLSRESHGENPGQHRIRMALVADVAEIEDAAQRIRAFLEKF